MDTLLRTKLYMPQTRPEMILRRHLLDRLKAGMGRNLTLISAPAGFGKTTLISGWLGSQAYSCAWFSLDESDDDPVQFLRYITAAFEQIDPALGEGVYDLLRPTQLSSLKGALTQLMNNIMGKSDRLILVLDDYHFIQSSAVHDLAAFLLDNQPPNLHLVILTREDPPLPLPRLRARGQLSEFRADDLRFSEDETASLLEAMWNAPPDSVMVRALTKRTEGWAAALQLAVASAGDRDDLRAFVEQFDGSHRHIADYLIEEVINRQPQPIREFLHQTAILERLNAPLCDAVGERADSTEMLKQMEKTNLFIIPLDDRREWYRYHRLFADFLRANIAPDQKSALHRRAAAWYDANDYQREAIGHVLSAGHFEDAAEMIADVAGNLFRNGEIITLLRWLDALPEEHVRDQFDLAMFKAWCLFATEGYSGCEPYVRILEKLLPSDADRFEQGRLRLLQVLVSSSHAESYSRIREAAELLGWDDPVFSTIALLLLSEQQMLENPAQAEESVRHTFELARQKNDVLIEMVAGGDLIVLLDIRAERQHALNMAHQIIDPHRDSRGVPLPITGIVLVHLGSLLLKSNELDEAERLTRLSGKYCRQVGFQRLLPLVYKILAMIQYAQGKHDEAMVSLAETRRSAEESGNLLEVELCTSLKADFLLEQGKLAEAEAAFSSVALSEPEPLTPHHVPMYLTRARLLLAQNAPHQANRQLDKLARWCEAHSCIRDLIPIDLVRAQAALAEHNRPSAIQNLSNALEIAASEGYVRFFLEAAPPVQALLPDVRHVAPRFVDDLLTLLPDQNPPPPLLEPLTERETEVLRLVADGLSNRQIADRLFIAVGTVKKHINRIFGKLDARDRTHAILRAEEFDLL